MGRTSVRLFRIARLHRKMWITPQAVAPRNIEENPTVAALTGCFFKTLSNHLAVHRLMTQPERHRVPQEGGSRPSPPCPRSLRGAKASMSVRVRQIAQEGRERADQGQGVVRYHPRRKRARNRVLGAVATMIRGR